jgi:hypothetical protein
MELSLGGGGNLIKNIQEQSSEENVMTSEC